MMGNFLCFAILRLLCCATTRPIMRASCGPWLDLSFRVSSSLALLLELRTGRESERENREPNRLYTSVRREMFLKSEMCVLI